VYSCQNPIYLGKIKTDFTTQHPTIRWECALGFWEGGIEIMRPKRKKAGHISRVTCPEWITKRRSLKVELRLHL
jgi:hypothetical protein